MKYIAEIPARMGSKRVKQKNLRLIAGKPLIAYAIEACRGAARIDDTYVNSESETFGRVAEEYGVKFYRRPKELAEDDIVSDQFNYDFLCSIECDALVMVNPVSPLVESSDIDAAVKSFEEQDLDTLISVRNERLQAFFDSKPLNFDTNGLLPMTQDLKPVRLCVWTVCIWRKKTFIESFEEKGFSVFSGKVGFFPVDPLKAVKISTEEDFRMAERLIEARRFEKEEQEPQYYDGC